MSRSAKLRRQFQRLFGEPQTQSHRDASRSRRLSFESLERREVMAADPFTPFFAPNTDFADGTVTPLFAFNVTENTGEKPQSKVWTHDGKWWSVMPDSGGTWIWRLDGNTWNKAINLSSNTSVNADVLPTGNLVHVLLFDGTSTQLASVEYSGSGYQTWSARPQLTNAVLSSSVETATITVDSTGRMWLASDASSTVEVRYSDFPYLSFSGPITIGSGMSSDDISAIAALPNGSVGVLWSNQNSERFHFTTHQDGANPNLWSTEIAAGQSALNVGGGMADDHINIKIASDGTLYAAVKTSYDSGGQTKIGMLVRRPNGVWDPIYHVDTSGTRPILILNEAIGRVMVAYTTSESGGNIVYRESSTANISFGARGTLLNSTLNNVTSTKQNVVDQLLVMAAGGNKAHSALLTLPFTVPQSNQAPQVNAGADLTAQILTTVNLQGVVTDDGLPNGSVSTLWTATGPASVNFGNATSRNTTALFTTAGTYVLRLTGNDGELGAFDELTVVVNPAGGGGPGPTSVTQAVASFQDGINGYNGTRDSMVASGTATTKRGSVATLSVDGSPDEAALLKWDISSIPAGSTIQSASITLNITNTSSHIYEVYELLRNWTEADVTWNRFNATTNWGTGGAQAASDRSSVVLGTLNATTTGKVTIQLNAAGIAAVQRWLDNPQSNFGIILQDYVSASDGLDFSSRETSTASNRPQLTINYSTPGVSGPTNQAPQVNAGSNQSIVVSGAAALDGTVSDDGLPSPAAVTTTWSKLSGPGNVTFANSAAVDTLASFSLVGTYVLRLTANDGELGSTDDVTITVNSVAPQNQGPNVNAGSDQTITLLGSASLDGTVSDDGLPLPGSLTTTWSKISGPGTVTFGNSSAVDTSASFSAAGTYVLRLTGNDGALATTDDVTITVNPAAPQNQAPSVNAGGDQTITLPNTVSLDSTVSDDGLPGGNLTTSWSKVSGPGTVTFGNASAVDTNASFSAAGIYVLRLTANDGSISSTDEVTITVNPAPSTASGLVGHWRFDETSGVFAADSSGSGNHATLMGGASFTTGQISRALLMSSSSQRAVVADSASLDISNQITIAAWISPQKKGTQYVVKKARMNSTDGFELSLSDSGKVFVRFNQTSSGNSFRVDSSTSYPTNGTAWMHVAATYDGSTIRLYINGVLQASRSASFQIGVNNVGLGLGAQDDGNSALKGRMDDVRIYNRAISVSELAAIMNG